MRFLKFTAFVAVMALSAQSASAGVYASTLFTVDNARVQYSSTGVLGSFADATAAQVNVTLNGLSVNNEVNLGAITDQVLTSFGTVPADAAQAFVTSGADVAPGPNTFTRTVPLPSGSAFARADSLTDGSLLTPGVAGGLDTTSVAEIEATDLSLGGALSSSGGTSVFVLQALSAGYYRLIFDTEIDLMVEALGPPLNRLATASTSLTIQLNNSVVSLDSPAGIASQSISTAGANDTLLVSATGVATDAILIGQGGVNVLSITQTATVSLRAVPEPASLLCFAAIGIVGFRRRRRA